MQRPVFRVYSALSWQPEFVLTLPRGFARCQMQYEHHEPTLPCWYFDGTGYHIRAEGMFHLADRAAYMARLAEHARSGVAPFSLWCFDWESPGVTLDSREAQMLHARFMARMRRPDDDEREYAAERALFEAESPRWYEEACALVRERARLCGFFNVEYPASAGPLLRRVRDAATAVFPACYGLDLAGITEKTRRWVAGHSPKPVYAFVWPWNSENPAESQMRLDPMAAARACQAGGAAGCVLWDHVDSPAKFDFYSREAAASLSAALRIGWGNNG